MYFDDGNISMFYMSYGDSSSSILILPGWGDTRNTFNNIIDNFKNDYKIYIFDYPGFGNSPIPSKKLTIYDYANFINSFINANKINNPIIIAHSFGGRITSILSNSINIKKIILIDVAGIKRRKSIKVFFREKLYRFLKRVTYIFPYNKRKILQNKLLNYFSSPDYNNIPICMRGTFQNIIREDLRECYKKIKSDTLILWGDKDCDTPLKDGIFLNKNIKGSALIVFKGVPHFSYLYNPLLVNRIIYEFISK